MKLNRVDFNRVVDHDLRWGYWDWAKGHNSTIIKEAWEYSPNEGGLFVHRESEDGGEGSSQSYMTINHRDVIEELLRRRAVTIWFDGIEYAPITVTDPQGMGRPIDMHWQPVAGIGAHISLLEKWPHKRVKESI